MADISDPIKPLLLADLLRQGLHQGQKSQLEVSSNSMAPLLRRGDRVILEAVTPEQLAPGDVITLADLTGITTHRYWSKTAVTDPPRLLTRGDRPLVFDPPWPPEALVGRMVGRSRRTKSLWVTSGAGRLLNRHLCWLAKREFQWWGHRVDGAAPIRRAWLRRWLRGAIYAWATIFAGILSLIG